MPAVYDDEKTKDDELRKITGINPADEKAMEARAHDDLAREEASGGEPDNNKAADKEKDKLDDQVGKGYTDNEEKSKPKGRLDGRRKQGIIAGSLVTLAVGAGGMGFLAAPNFIVNHLREILLGKISELQTHQSLRYRRKKFNKISDMFSKDGRRGGRVIADMEKRGYRFEFTDPADGNKITRLVGPNGSPIDGDAIGEHLSDYMEIRHPLRTSRWKTKRMEAFYSRYKVSRVAAVTKTSGDLEDPDRAVNKKMADEVTGDGMESEAKARSADGEETDEEKAVREGRNDELDDLFESDGSLDDLKNKLREGTPIEELSVNERKLLDVHIKIDQELADLLDNMYTSGGLAGRAFKGLKSFGSSTDIADKVCTVKNRLRAVVLAARAYRARGLLKYASIFVSASDATRRGKVDPGLMNSLMKRVTAMDSNGVPIGASPGFAYALKNRFSKSQNDAFKGSYGVDGKLAGVPKAIQDATDRVPATGPSACKVWQNPGFQIGVAALEIGAAIFTGGTSSAAGLTGREAAEAAIKQSLKSIISKQTAKALIKTIAIELSFEGIMALTQVYAEKSMSLNFTGQEKGAELGNILIGGAGTMNKQRSLQAGMVPATTEQYAQATQEYVAWKEEEVKKLSFYERIFDYSNYDSLAFNLASTAITMPTTPASMGLTIGAHMNKITSALLANPASLLSTIGSSFSNRVFAQSDELISTDSYQVGSKYLATDPAGNLLPIMRSDIEDIDPEKNAEELIASGDIDASTLEPKSENFKEHVKNCVEEIDSISTLENKDQSDPKFDCLATLKITAKYKAHLAYLDMLDVVDADLFPNDIASGGGGASTTTGTSTAPTTVDVATLYEPSESISCAGGSRDIGVHDGYHAGTPFKVRLCAVDSIPETGSSDALPGSNGKLVVNSRISAIYVKVAQDAAAAGIQVSAAEGFRTMARQEYFWNCYQTGSCNNGNLAARPGNSNHQAGVAVDWSPAVYNWLSANGNAAKYGLKQCTCGEQWHYSPTGG